MPGAYGAAEEPHGPVFTKETELDLPSEFDALVTAA
jgi:hypothetical protein